VCIVLVLNLCFLMW